MNDPPNPERDERPFGASWIDRINHGVTDLPIPTWISFVTIGAILVGIQLLVLWLDGGWGAAELLPILLFNGLFTPFLLALILLLDRQAVSGLDAMRPALTTHDADIARLRYRLSTMPARAALAAGAIALSLVIALERLGETPLRYAALDELSLFAIPFHLVDKSSAFLFGVFVYHTLRQLRLVHDITVHHARVDLFHREPLQAFSRLTASTAVGLVVGVYGWMLLNPELLSDPVSLGVVAAITLLAIAVFVLPLLGVHGRLEAAKRRTLQTLDLHAGPAFARFEERLRDGDHAALERLGRLLADLEEQRGRIERIPTWPWRPAISRFVATAIATPSVLAALRLLVEQSFGS